MAGRLLSITAETRVNTDEATPEMRLNAPNRPLPIPTTSPEMDGVSDARPSLVIWIRFLNCELPKASNMASLTPSNCDSKSFSLPATVSFMMSAIFCAAPLEFAMDVVRDSKSCGLAFTSVRNPDIACLPAIMVAYWPRWASVRLLNLLCSSGSNTASGFMEPSELTAEIFRSFSAVDTSLVGLASRVMTELRLVPASPPFTPALAIRPSAAVTSWTL